MLIQLSVVLCCLSAASGTYVAYFPNSLIPGIPLQVRVLVQNGGGPVSICAGLKFAENESVVAENTISVNSGMYSTIPINVPSTLRPSNYRAFVTGSGALVFTNSSSIHYNNRSLMVFIQTDKVRYSAGQTVRYRAVFLLPNLMGFQGEATVIIQDGQENKIETRAPLLVKNGVISGEIELSKYPVFGNWTIGIDVMGRTHTQYFEVNEYVLPRFTVSLEIPPTINASQASFTIGVKARFTFKTDVNGNCTVLLYNEGDTSKTFQLSNDIKGTAEFIMQMSKVTSELDISSNIKVRAMVTDNATALTMVAERRLNIASNKPLPITITKIDAYKNSYIPGMTYRAKIFVGRNGKSLGRSGKLTVTPSVTTAILQHCSYNSPTYKWLKVNTERRRGFTITFDESGYADLAYLESTKNVEKISFKIMLQDQSIQLFAVSSSFNIYPLSDNKPFLRMNANKFRTKVGESIVVDVTATENLNGALTFEVYARGMHLISERVAINNAATKKHTMTVTKDMIPSAFIIVNHLTQTGHLIADYVYIHVQGNPFKNEVEISFNATEPQPGETVNMHATADPHSTIYILAEDLRNRVFGVDNDIFWTDVVREIVDASPSIMQNVKRYGNRSKREDQVRQLSKRSHGDLGDLDDKYIESGLIVLSDATVTEKKLDLLSLKGYKQECKAQDNTSLWNSVNCDNCTDINKILFFSLVSSNIFGGKGDGQNFLNFLPSKDDDKNNPGLSLEEIVRSKFPDTWLWEEYDIGMNGEIDIAHKIPDSMTTWVTSVFAINPETGFGIAETKPEILVQKKFFLTMDLPSSIVHGEEFLLQISVFNNYPINKLVFLRITLSENPDNPIPASTEVKGNDGQSTFIRIQPEQIGELNITVTAYIMGTFFFTIPDQMMKSVTVRPNGVFKTTNEQHLIDVSPESSQVIKHIEIVHPDDMVENSRFTKVIITGNFMVPSINGLDNLIRMPYGCGEQTMINFAPAIFIHDYLTVVEKLTPDIKMKSTKILKTGLQRELRYQRRDGSFSAFGNRDSSGSSWLTAFVLKCFGQAKDLIQIDDSVMVKAMVWLLRYQNRDGSFREPGRVIHYQMQGGSSSGIKMSAFILISLLENRNVSTVQGTDVTIAIRKASTFLEAKLSYVKDSYSLAIICYALASANSPSRAGCYRKLKKAAFYDDDKTYWKANHKVTKREVGDRALRNRAPSMDVEASSYALLTYMKLGYYTEAFPIVKWLVSQRNPTGGQRSTQDTVISIQALAEFATNGEATPGPNYGVKFELSHAGKFNHVYTTNLSTFDFVHTFELPFDVETFTLQATGSGSAIIDVSTSYYVTGNENDDNIEVKAIATKESINTVTIESCLRWTASDNSGMLLMEVEMPTGFQPDDNLLNSQDSIMKHETNGRNIALYFNGVNPNTDVCVDVKMDRVDPVVKSQACHVKAYDYYDPAHQAITRYEFGLLKEPNICKICPLCGFCMTGEPIGVGR